ncbi:PEGA domain-containing protein [Candidatus Poribacteria bacterium]|nr:PEGA domain-containing protein [Candidatus Poribacteria bacterium]
MALALCVAAAGCVRSKAVVTSEPPGADVTMNDVHVGRTPVEVPFTWYWFYDFKADLDGYETTVQRERFHAPVYLWPGLDLLMEAMPFRVTDTKHVYLAMKPERQRPAPVLAGE